MIQKEITICGKQVIVAYCYATEINYKNKSKEDILGIIREIVDTFREQKNMPDVQKSIWLILAAAKAYYDSQNKQMPIDEEMMKNEVTPDELGTALAIIFGLRAEFHMIPDEQEEEEQKQEDENPKNA